MNYLDLLTLANEIKTDNFVDYSFQIENKIKNANSRYLNITNTKNYLEMAVLFALTSKDSGDVCSAKMEGIGGWRCLDCVKIENGLFCQNCWAKMKTVHSDHNIEYVTTTNGTCDCGDPNIIDPKYFCPKHKGPITNDKDIQVFINQCLGGKTALDLKLTTATIFDQMAAYVIKAIQEKKTNLLIFLNNMADFFELINIPCNTSRACMYIISELLLTNYPFKTKHVCIQVKGFQPQLVKSSLFSHECCCPFIRLLMPLWPEGKEQLIYSFLHNYKLKKVIGLCYFLLYGEMICNCLPEFQDLSVQFLSDNVCQEAMKIEGLIENMYENMTNIFTIYLKTQNYKELSNEIPLCDAIQMMIDGGKPDNKYVTFKEHIYKLRNDTIYIMKRVSLNFLGRNTKIIFQLIDLLCFLHNINSVKVIEPHPSVKQGNKYIIHLLDAEIWLLDIFAAYITIFDFSSNNLVKDVFSYFSKKINNSKLIIDSKEYTFHIPLYRAFSIFLNRYCFYYANTNNTDLFQGLQSALKIFPSYKDCFKIMLKSIFKVFGFITACGEELFDYYGDSMIEYEYHYYYNYEFVYRDFCLMKYILTLKETKKYFSFDKILELCQVENSHKPLEENILKGVKMIAPSKWLKDSTKPYLRFCSKILRLILIILRNNTCLLWTLGSSYSMIKPNKIEDTLIKDIINKEKDCFVELVKELIVNKTCIKENLAFYTDIYDSVFLCLKETLGHEKIKELILSFTNKTLTQDKKAKFSIKDENLRYLDLNYIIYPTHKSTVEKYISDFKKRIVSIFNTHFYPVNKFEKKLTIEGYKQIYFNEDNFDFLFRFTAFILRREAFFDLNEYFLAVLLNYLAAFFCIENDQFIFFREFISNKIIQLIHVLEDNSLTDDVHKSYCHFIVEKIAENDKIYVISKKKVEEPIESDNSSNQNIINDDKNEIKNEIIVQPVKKNTKISMKDKMKNKFKKKNDNISNKYGIEKIKIEKKKNNEACIYCLKPIEDDDIKKPYGKIGDYLHDNYLSNAFFQVIRKEFKIYYDKNPRLKEFDDIYYQPPERKNVRIISCNHLIHFSCYFEGFMKKNLKIAINICQCPLCHKISEAFIPIVDQYTEEQTLGIFKGYSFNYVYNFGKNNAENFKTILAKLKERSKALIEEKLEDLEEEEINKFKEKIIPEIPPYDTSNIEEKNDEKKYDINTFKKEYPDFINACKHYIESFIGMKLLINSVDLNSGIVRTILDNLLIIFSVQFRDLLDFFQNIEDDKKTSLNLWKNLLLSMRLTLKLKIMDEGFFFCNLYSLIEQLKTLSFESPLDSLIKNDTLKLKMCKIFFLMALLFDYNEIEGYEKYMIYLCLPIFGFGFFFKDIYLNNTFTFYQDKFLPVMTEEKMFEYLKTDKLLVRIITQVVKQILITKFLIKNEMDLNLDKVSLELNDMLDLLNLSELKNKSFLEILDYLDQKLMEEKGTKMYEIFYPKNNYKEALKILLNHHIEVAKEKKCDGVLSPNLFGSCIPIIYNFIDLPLYAVEFVYDVYNKPCEYCKQKGQNALICLDCGKKVCDSRKCLTEVNEIKVPGFIAHTKKCGGGRSIFLQTYNCSALFVSNKVVFQKFLPFYINEFGEGITKLKFGAEFKLCKEEVKKALAMFTRYTYSNAPLVQAPI